MRVVYGVLLSGEENGFPQKELGTGSDGARGHVKQWRDLSLVQCLCNDSPATGLWRLICTTSTARCKGGLCCDSCER